MRIVEPTASATDEKPKKSNKRRSLIVVIVVFVLTGGGYFFILNDDNEEVSSSVANADTTQNEAFANETESVQRTGELRIFTDNEFTVFYNNLLQPDLERVENPPVITGDDDADIRIRAIAEARGYRLRSSPSDSATLVSVDGYQLHEAVAEPWEGLQQAAANDGLSMSIVSGYRSVENQRNLFTARLSAAGASVASVAAGSADDIVNEVLVESSIPGYSKHHTAYTIDLKCAGYVFEDFKNSPCFEWIAANNYEQAKTYGFIPSYPPEADAQGPDPEAWEYVYVGAELLRQ